MYSNLTDLARPKVGAGTPDDLRFPSLMGARVAMSHPGLELVKQLTMALSLEGVVQDEVRKMRENLFRVLGINAWGAEGAFSNPCQGVVLHDVVCQYCNLMKDVDLCRNGAATALLAGNEEEGGEDEGEWGVGVKVRVLQCEACTCAYDGRMVEERIIRSVRQRMLRYQLQDLVCKVCGSMQDKYLQRRCDCSGEYRGQREEGGKEERIAEWRVMERVCKEYGYVEAHEMISFVRRMEGGADQVDSAVVELDERDVDVPMTALPHDDSDEDA